MSRALNVERLWRDRFRDQQNSGLSVARYWAEKAVSESSFCLWHKPLANGSAEMSMPVVEVIATPPSMASVCASAGRGVIEILPPDSLVVRLDIDVHVLRLSEVIAARRDVDEVR